MSFSDTLPTDSTGPNDYVAYAIEVDNDRGRSAGLSHPVEIPAAATSTLHGTPSAELTPDSVIVTAHVTQQNPAVAQTLELRRQQKGATEEETTVAQRPLEVGSPGESSNLELRDDSLVWEKKYQYRVVVVGVAKIPENGNVTFAGSISPEIEIATHDVFPPNVPTGIQAVFSGSFAGQQSSIDLTWNPNLDRDLRGYFIYRRRQDEPAPLATKLNTQPVTTPAYRDTAVQSGNTYVYSVSAVDERGNESKRSEEASEQVPK